MSHRVTIIVPVYGDWPSLHDCIDSLKKHVNIKRDGHRIMFVNDCGPDVELMEKNILAAITQTDGFSYIRNEKNLGFVGTCNRAVLELEADSQNDILLLNSDTIVTDGFIEELTGLLHDYPLLGAVSPRTNNATIATIPISEMHNKGIAHDKAYGIYSSIREMLPRYSITPVAHGFCMLIRKECIQKFGLFDPIFGKGYGEETDFCMRINANGYVCALSNHSFVFHMEARSFSIETKNKLLEQNNKIMWRRYPFYRAAIHDYLDYQLDPIDRFAHNITHYSVQRYLVDIRGLQHVTDPTLRSQIIQSIDAIRKSTKKDTLYYVLDGPRPSELSVPPEQTLSEKSIKGTFAIGYRPLEATSLSSLTLLNRHCLRIVTSLPNLDTIIKSSNVPTNSMKRVVTDNVIALSDIVISDKRYAIVFPSAHTPYASTSQEALQKLEDTPIDGTKLCSRWQRFAAAEKSHHSHESKTTSKKLKQKTKSALARAPLLHKAAKKLRSTLRK